MLIIIIYHVSKSHSSDQILSFRFYFDWKTMCIFILNSKVKIKIIKHKQKITSLNQEMLSKDLIDPSKKKFCNLLVRCGEHGASCRELQEKAEGLKMSRILFEDLLYFHFHSSGGVTLDKFKARFARCDCKFNFHPIAGGLSNYLIYNSFNPFFKDCQLSEMPDKQMPQDQDLLLAPGPNPPL